jgi:hypothetical protein
MSISQFILIGILWLADMGALVSLASIGRHAYLFALLFCLGHVLMILLVQKFPSGLSAGKAWIIILGLGDFLRGSFINLLAADFFPETVNGFFIIRAAENGRSSYKYVNSGGSDVADGFFIDAAVDLDQGFYFFVPDHFAQAHNFVEGVGDKGLTAKSGIDTHNQYVVNVLNNPFYGL